MELDNQYVRASNQCPLCDGPKGAHLVACWTCYHTHGLKYGNESAERAIAAANEALKGVAQ